MSESGQLCILSYHRRTPSVGASRLLGRAANLLTEDRLRALVGELERRIARLEARGAETAD